jgi:phospholipid-binding lipoprotein MlaA
VFDFAKRKPFHLPRRVNGLANTLGYYGVGTGPFLFLPLVGPTTLRDAIGDGLDRLLLPIAVGKPFNKPYVGIPVYVFSSMDQRAEYDEKLEAQHNSADPYTTTREDYLKSREDAINALHGRPPRAVTPKPDKGAQTGAATSAPAAAPAPAAPAPAPVNPPAPQSDAPQPAPDAPTIAPPAAE